MENSVEEKPRKKPNLENQAQKSGFPEKPKLPKIHGKNSVEKIRGKNPWKMKTYGKFRGIKTTEKSKPGKPSPKGRFSGKVSSRKKTGAPMKKSFQGKHHKTFSVENTFRGKNIPWKNKTFPKNLENRAGFRKTKLPEKPGLR